MRIDLRLQKLANQIRARNGTLGPLVVFLAEPIPSIPQAHASSGAVALVKSVSIPRRVSLPFLQADRT